MNRFIEWTFTCANCGEQYVGDMVDPIHECPTTTGGTLKRHMTLGTLQKEQKVWSDYNFPGQHDWQTSLMGMVEEMGELHHALLKQKQGIRGTWDEHEAAAKDAIGDILIYMADFCSERGWNMQDIIFDTWNTVSKRDWQKDPVHGS